eukprot:EG_transcript_5868
MDDLGASDSTKPRKGTKLKTQIVKDFEVSREKLGSGSYASVWKGWHRLNREQLAAVKVINLQKVSARLHGKIDLEIQILKGLHHPNIVQLYDVKQSDKYIILILEYCGGGDLSRHIKERRRPGQGALGEAVAVHFMRQLAQGMYFLHSRNLVHRDIKPQNLLLSSSDLPTATLKIADFGFARYLAFDPSCLDLAKTLCGSPVYMAPEILSRRNYGANVDLWSAGAVLFEMLFGDPPFRGDTLLDLQRNVEAGLQLPPHADTLGPLCVDLLQRLLKGDPEARIPWSDFFCHPFLFQEGMYDQPSAPATPLLAGSGLAPAGQASGDSSLSGSGLSALFARKASISAETQTSPVADPLRSPPPALSAAEREEALAAARGDWFVSRQLAELARLALTEGGYAEGYLLYERALELLVAAQRKVTRVHPLPEADESLADGLEEAFPPLFDAATKLASLLRQRPATGKVQPVEQLILEHAVRHCGADGVVEEMLGNTAPAQALYEQGRGLLQYLRQLPALDAGDRKVVQDFLRAFERRLHACGEAARPGEAAPGGAAGPRRPQPPSLPEPP